MDACVLIDFVTIDESVLTLASRYLGDVYVASPVLAEVRQLDSARAASLGMKVIEPDLDMVMLAASNRDRLSMQDHLCLLLAKANGWTCVSNDRRLRASCVAQSVSVMWGLEILIRLVEAGALSAKSARNLGKRIAESNPRLGRQVMARFFARVGDED